MGRAAKNLGLALVPGGNPGFQALSQAKRALDSFPPA